MRNWKKLLISLALPQMAAAIAAYVTITGSGSWYEDLLKPAWNPPSWLFGPVWTLLYVLMGIAFYLVWKSDGNSAPKKLAMTLWGLQLVLNFCWSIIFFKLQETGWATLEIALLWLVLLVTIFAVARISRLSAWLLVPY
ncbi:MAG TPA: TspO/MBR family protein, partial [Flavisolibacter sp.]|nr:TspO/MBR family protein [Flavisolibacter sp.]